MGKDAKANGCEARLVGEIERIMDFHRIWMKIKPTYGETRLEVSLGTVEDRTSHTVAESALK